MRDDVGVDVGMRDRLLQDVRAAALATARGDSRPLDSHARTGSSKYTASMDIDAAQEALFEEVYDTEHLPAVRAVPGVLAVARLRTESPMSRW